jgi:hypothetical protein
MGEWFSFGNGGHLSASAFVSGEMSRRGPFGVWLKPNQPHGTSTTVTTNRFVPVRTFYHEFQDHSPASGCSPNLIEILLTVKITSAKFCTVPNLHPSSSTHLRNRALGNPIGT